MGEGNSPLGCDSILRLTDFIHRSALEGVFCELRQDEVLESLEGVMNFGSETVAFWHDYSNTIPK